MIFKTPCLIHKVSEELINKLVNIGYKLIPSVDFTEYPKNCIKCEGGICWEAIYCASERYIDCGEDEELFSGLASMTDQRRSMQWWVSELDTFYYVDPEFEDKEDLNGWLAYVVHDENGGEQWRKAEAEDIIRMRAKNFLTPIQDCSINFQSYEAGKLYAWHYKTAELNLFRTPTNEEYLKYIRK